MQITTGNQYFLNDSHNLTFGSVKPVSVPTSSWYLKKSISLVAVVFAVAKRKQTNKNLSISKPAQTLVRIVFIHWREFVVKSARDLLRSRKLRVPLMNSHLFSPSKQLAGTRSAQMCSQCVRRFSASFFFFNKKLVLHVSHLFYIFLHSCARLFISIKASFFQHNWSAWLWIMHTNTRGTDWFDLDGEWACPRRLNRSQGGQHAGFEEDGCH